MKEITVVIESMDVATIWGKLDSNYVEKQKSNHALFDKLYAFKKDGYFVHFLTSSSSKLKNEMKNVKIELQNKYKL